MADRFTFTAPLWRWTAREDTGDAGAWCFVTLPSDAASGSFALPVKKAVRTAAGVEEGDQLTVTLSVRADTAGD